MNGKTFALPGFSLRHWHVWRRNALVWRKLAIPSMLGNLADPLIYMLGLGYGLGAMLADVEGMSYIAFLATGIVCSSTMMAATFEAMYSSFTRMHVQKTWEAIMNAPVSLDDVVLGEAVWAASKSLLSGVAVLLVAWAIGVVQSALALWAIPILFLTGFAFASLGLIMTAASPSYDFFMYYFTLVITPMLLVSGVFFPLSQLPAPMQAVTQFLPLSHAVELVRPLMSGTVPDGAVLHLAVLAAYAVPGYYIALVLTRRRLLK
jgi:lipooligosaccharide transport system permease protein